MAAEFKDLSEGWLPLFWPMITSRILLWNRMNTSANHILLEVVKVCLSMVIKSPRYWPWNSAFRWIKSRASWWFNSDYLSRAWPWGAVVAFSGLWYGTYGYFQGLYIVSNCSWWQKSSAWLCRNQSRSLTDINLDECTSWSLLRVCRRAAWVTSPPQRASCGSRLWGALQLVSMCTTWFLADWTDSCWQEKASSCLQNSWWRSRKLRSEHKKSYKR